MAEQIEQQFLIDAAKALQTLSQLDQSFKAFESRLTSTAQAISNFNSGSTNATSGVASLNKQLGSAGNTASNLASAASTVSKAVSGIGSSAAGVGNLTQALQGSISNAEKLGLTLETINRVASTQVLLRGYNALRDAISEAVTTAGEFEKKVALIQTINQNTSFDQTADSIKRLSTEFNVPLLEAANSVYTALSNQVGNFGETLTFTAEAAKFATATNSSLADSVDLLSGAMHSYGLGLDETNRISSIFFATIDEGRVTADQLANSFGRVGPIAAQVGVSLEEVGTLISVIGQKGSSTAETLTQVRSLLSAFVKPSDAMKKALADLGFTSADVGIKTLGLIGFLKALKATSGETSAELAALTPNVRALNAILSATGDGARELEDVLAKIKKSADDGIATEKFATATATRINTVEKAFNALKNNVLSLGTQFVTAESQAVDFATKVNSAGPLVTGTIDALTSGVAGATVGVVGLGVAINGVALASRGLSAALLTNPLFLITAAATGAAFALTSIVTAQQEIAANKQLQRYFDLEKQGIDDVAKAAENLTKQLGVTSSQISEVVRAGFADSRDEVAAYNKALDSTRDANERLVSSTQSSLDRIVDARRAVVQELSRAVNDSLKQIESSQDRVFKLTTGRDQAKFDSGLKGLSDPSKIVQLTQKARELAEKAAQDLARAAEKGDDKAIQRALATFDNAQSLASQAKSINDRIDSRFQEARVVNTINDITAQQIQAEKTLQSLESARVDKLQQQKETQQALLKDIERQAKIVLDNTGQFNAQGERFSDKEIAQRTVKRDAALEKLLSAEFQRGTVDLSDILGLAEFKSKYESTLTDGPRKLAQAIREQDLGVTSKIQSELEAINATPLAKAIKAVFHRELDADELLTPQQFDSFGKRLEEEAKRRLEATKKSVTSSTTLENSRRELDQLFADARGINDKRLEGKSPEALKSTSFGRFALAMDEGIDKIEELAKQGIFAGKEVNAAFASIIKTVNEVDFASQMTLKSSADIVGNIKKELDQANEAQEEFAKAQKDALNPQEATQFTDIIGRLKELMPVQEARAVGDNLQAASTSVTSLTTNVGNLTDALQKAATVAASIRVPSGDVFANFGSVGVRYFADGGVARGADRIHAMLAPGESIINSRATAKFFPQIQAINAMQSPSFRSDSGSVTNVGDITVNVGAGMDENHTARNIGNALRREIRRGTLRGF